MYCPSEPPVKELLEQKNPKSNVNVIAFMPVCIHVWFMRSSYHDGKSALQAARLKARRNTLSVSGDVIDTCRVPPLLVFCALQARKLPW